jgi:hypothetical protein
MHSHRKSTIGVGVSILLTLMAVLTALFMAMPSRADAHPHHNNGLTIAATPDPSTAGDGVLIYGRLLGPNNADRKIWLFHRINPAPRFTPVQVTRTNSQGFYEITRADGVVNTNRNWFVLGPDNTHSKTIHELVADEVTLSSASASSTTGQIVDFTGSVFPAHVHKRVLLQEQTSTSGNGWKTIDSGYTGGGSAFSIEHHFREAGSYTLRAFFPADPRNVASQSPSITQTIEQQQNPSFTISGSAQALVNGQTETISGTLYADGSTTTVQPNVSLTLYGRTPNGGFHALQSGMTNGSGEYSFTAMPVHNTVYRVVASAKQATANLFVGVQDVVTATPSATTDNVGGTITISGTVTPDHSGHVLYLQKQDTAGQWVDVKAGQLTNGSQYSFNFTPGMASTKNLRVQITGGPWNVGGISSTIVLTVSGVAPAPTLPTAS